MSAVWRSISVSLSTKSALHFPAAPFHGKMDDFENYRSGAWLYNDALHQFIHSVAVKAAGASSCTGFKFLAEGTSTRLFDRRLDNGAELIAKLPFVVHLTTASEVATMMFAREILEVPVPRVYTWCSRAEETKVGLDL
ncbi:hypothetical protein C8J57DRAFT_1670336 [Mycena rebaudengoi]|nr:hypothetical protein C8J57DRAFT_1670336 [Mycena rebaudengoi]